MRSVVFGCDVALDAAKKNACIDLGILDEREGQRGHSTLQKVLVAVERDGLAAFGEPFVFVNYPICAAVYIAPLDFSRAL